MRVEPEQRPWDPPWFDGTAPVPRPPPVQTECAVVGRLAACWESAAARGGVVVVVVVKGAKQAFVPAQLGPAQRAHGWGVDGWMDG